MASAAVRSRVVVLLLMILLLVVALDVCEGNVFGPCCNAVLSVLSSFEIFSLKK